jgi:hypothetical protein
MSGQAWLLLPDFAMQAQALAFNSGCQIYQIWPDLPCRAQALKHGRRKHTRTSTSISSAAHVPVPGVDVKVTRAQRQIPGVRLSVGNQRGSF